MKSTLINFLRFLFGCKPRVTITPTNLTTYTGSITIATDTQNEKYLICVEDAKQKKKTHKVVRSTKKNKSTNKKKLRN